MRYEINPWALGCLISLCLWAAIALVAYVMVAK
jgi:hypothetical protein